MFGLKLKGNDLIDVFVQVGGKPTNVTSNVTLKSSVLQKNGLKHDTLGAARLGKFKKSTDTNLNPYHQARKRYAQHIYRASCQAGYLWRQSVEELGIADPEQWGWKTDSKGNL